MGDPIYPKYVLRPYAQKTLYTLSHLFRGLYIHSAQFNYDPVLSEHFIASNLYSQILYHHGDTFSALCIRAIYSQRPIINYIALICSYVTTPLHSQSPRSTGPCCLGPLVFSDSSVFLGIMAICSLYKGPYFPMTL